MVKRIISLLLVSLMLISLASCVPEDAKPITLMSKKVQYTVVIAEDATEGARSAADKLGAHLVSVGKAMTVGNDATPASEDGREILIGKTNRPESASAIEHLNQYYDYSITVNEKNIVIAANTDERLIAAVEYFITQLSVNEKDVLQYIGAHSHINVYPYKYPELTLGGAAIYEYAIIVPAAATEADVKFAEELQAKIALEAGALLEVKQDTEPVGAYEFLIGKTNRPASAEVVSGELALKGESYSFKKEGGAIVLAAVANSGYKLVMKKVDELMSSENTAANENYITNVAPLEDGTNIMIIGNSFLYYGECVRQAYAREMKADNTKIGMVDDGYLSTLCNTVAKDVTVYNCTIGGATLTSLYDILLKQHPNHYGVAGKDMDSFYDQDFVVLQQAGENNSKTLEKAKALIAMFPPETQFLYFVHDHNVRNNHTNVLNAAKTLRDEMGVIYIPTGHMTYDVWRGVTKVPNSSIKYNKESFVVKWNDSHHPNFLTGYFSTVMIYSAITNKSCVGLDWSYVDRDDKTYYTKGTSNFVAVLDSEADMLALQKIADEYLAKYNP